MLPLRCRMKTPPMLFRRVLGAVALAVAASPGFAADAPPPTASSFVQTRTPWTPPAVWYDVDPGTWTAADIERIQRESRAGDAQAEYFMGVLNEDGKLIPRSLPDALRYYKMSAEQGNASAQASLSRMMFNGWATPQSNAEGIKWNAKAAAQNNRRALFNQAFFARRGMISPSGDAVIIPLFERAANLGLPQAALELARHYRSNEAERAQAWRWLGMATTSGFAPALVEFDAWCNKTPDGLDCLTQVGNALTRAAEAGYPPAQLQLGVRLWDSHDKTAGWSNALRNHFIDVALDTPGISTDKPEGARWLTRAAQAGNTRALFNVGLLLEEQNYRSKYMMPSYKVASIETIRTCYYHAAVAGVPDAMVALVKSMQQAPEDDPLSEQEREALSAYWTGKAGETGVFERNQMWAIHFPGWRKLIGTPAPVFLRKGLGEPAQCALEPLPGAPKDNS